MHEADAHPLGDHESRAFADLGKPFGKDDLIDRSVAGHEMWIVASNRELDELPEQRYIAARGRQFEVAEADERRRDPTDDGTWFRRRDARRRTCRARPARR